MKEKYFEFFSSIHCENFKTKIKFIYLKEVIIKSVQILKLKFDNIVQISDKLKTLKLKNLLIKDFPEWLSIIFLIKIFKQNCLKL